MRKGIAWVIGICWFVFAIGMGGFGFIVSAIENAAPEVGVPGFETPTTPTPGEGVPTPASDLQQTDVFVGTPVPPGFEAIDSLTTDITIRPNGDLAVVETIAYDFADLPRHGIYRKIPVRYHYDDTYDRIYPIEDIQVSGSPGTPTQLETGTEGPYLFLKIGDADRVISGVHTYEITYVVRGALNSFEEWDELYWNVVGDQWQVPIRAAHATVRLAQGEITAVRCFAGPTGSTSSCEVAQIADPPTSASFSQTGLPAYSGMTVVVAFPKGAVSTTGPILDERWSARRAFSLSALTVGLATGLLALGTALVGVLLWTQGRDRRHHAAYVGGSPPPPPGAPGPDPASDRVPLFDGEPAPVEYRPPDGILPGQLGTLVDETANPLDVTATVLDFAVRAKLRIEEIPKKGWFGKTDWNLVKLTDDRSDLRAYERRLFNALFEGRDAVKISDLKNTFHSDMAKVQDDLYDDMVAQGWFPRRPDKVRTHWGLIGGIVLVVGVGLTVLAAWRTTLGIIPLGIAVTGLILMLTARFMPHRTPAGTAMLRRVRGFERFMQTAETERMQFAEEENIFAKYLPYAIVFDLVDKWAAAFQGMGEDPTESTAYFYSAAHAFDAAAFTSAMDDFTTTTSGTLVSTPSSSGSSGFSGGGSGGGGGGGGGGSW
ncbi:MAG: DUF2207 domain-containing protein [Acidimicrobiia bacterium]|nr:DUF2207 domain-containing protein [Acidimicrobiia bacterium]